MYTQNHGKIAESDVGVPVPPPDYGGHLTFPAARSEEESAEKRDEEKEREPDVKAEKPPETDSKPASVLPRFIDKVSAEDLLLLGAVLFLLFSGRSESLMMPLVLVAAILL